MSDGRLDFDTKVDTSGIKQGKKDIEKEMSLIEKISSKARNAIRKSFKLDKKDTQIELTYAAQNPKSFFEENIKDEEYAIKSINEELAKAQRQLDMFKKAEGTSNDPKIVQSIKDAEAQIETYKRAIEEAKTRLNDNRGWLAERIEIDKVQAKVDELQAKMDKMNATGVDTSSQSYRNLTYDLELAKAKLDSLTHSVDSSGVNAKSTSEAFQGVADNAKQAGASISESMGKNTTNAIAKSANSLSRFGRMLKRMLIMRVLYAVIRAFTDGLKNLAKSSPEVNKDLSEISSSLNYVKDAFIAAFSPLVSVVVPVINTICNALAKLLNYFAMVIATLTGKNTYKKAIKEQKDYAASLDKTAGSAKKTERALAGFDEINQLNLSDSGGGGGSTTPSLIDEEMQAEQIGWIDKIKTLWEDVVQVAKNIGASFKKAWDSGAGERITSSIGRNLDYAYKTIKKCTEATVKWSENLDLEPLLSSIAGLFESMEPFIRTAYDILGFLYTEILLPIGEWILEVGLPAFFDSLSGTLSMIGRSLESLKPALDWLWKNIIEPFVDYIGDGLSEGLKAVASFLGVVAGVLITYNAAMTIASVVTGAFNAVMTFLTSPIGLVLLAITALIAIITLLIKHWDDVKKAASDCWNWVCGVFSAAANWFDNNVIKPISDGFKGLANGVLGFFESLANGCISVFESIVNFFVDAINAISFDIPDWLGGGHVGFNLNRVSLGRVSLPRLATGTVVPPNACEFAAILGDNKRDTEVVSPLSTMKQALAEVLAEYGSGQDVHLEVNGSLAALVRLLKIELAKEDKRKGKKLVIT